MSKKKEMWYVVLGELIVHTIVGLAYFAAMAVPAVLIYMFNKWLTDIGVEGFTMTMLYVAEATFLLFDFYAICRYIYLSVRENH
jgi:hypothetical protein